MKGWATIPNLRCKGQKEIDLFAIDPRTMQRFHIETSVSISGSFSKLNAKPFDPKHLKVAVKAAGTRRTLDFFREHKFECPNVGEVLGSLGCNPDQVERVIVTWGATDDAMAAAQAAGIKVWLFPDLLHEIAEKARGGKSYFGDDTLRTLTLFAKAADAQKKKVATK